MPQPCSIQEVEAAAALEVSAKQEKDAKYPLTAGTLPSWFHHCSGNQQHLKKSQTKEYKVPCPAKISFEAKVETCQIGSTQARSQAKYREEKFAAKMPESLARSYKCSYFYSSLNLVNLHIFFLLEVASLHRISACSRTSLSVLLTDTGKWGDSPEPAISFAEEEKRKHRELASMSLSLTFQFLNSVKL